MRVRTLIPSAFAVVAVLAPAGAASAATTGGAAYEEARSTPSQPVTAASRAVVRNGLAYAPNAAPLAVKKMIWAGNRIADKPYKWGGGHGRWEDTGYDCSGAISYVMHAAGLLRSPLVAPAFNRAYTPGRGRWVTIYANGGHVYAVIAGVRFDTSSFGDGGRGPEWRRTSRDPSSFTATHPRGL